MDSVFAAGRGPAGDYKYTVKKNNFDVIKTGNARFILRFGHDRNYSG